jgi:hypothetical protein
MIMPNEPKLSHSRGRPPTQHAQERSRCTATEKRGGSAQLGRSPLEADAIAVWIFEIPLFHAVVSNNRLLHINELGARECKPPSISDPQKVLPFAKFTPKAHAFPIWNVEMIHRSICLPDFPAVSHVHRYSLRD